MAVRCCVDDFVVRFSTAVLSCVSVRFSPLFELEALFLACLQFAFSPFSRGLFVLCPSPLRRALVRGLHPQDQIVANKKRSGSLVASRS